MKKPKKKSPILLYGMIAAGALVIVTLIYFAVSEHDGSITSKKNKKSNMAKTSDPTKSNKSGPGSAVDEESSMNDGATPEIMLDHYLEWAKYPPHSRPLSADNYDLIHPFKVDNSPITMFDDPKSSKEPNGYRCLFQPRTWFIAGSGDIFISLECRDGSNQPAKIKINSHTMFKDWEGKTYPTHSADFNDDGRDGDETAKDNIYTFKWRPMKQDWGQMSLQADISYGRENKNAKVTSSFFSSPGKPAEFGNYFHDSIVEGSLVIRVQVNVYRTGTYHLEANLKEAEGGNYVAYSVFDGKLKAGTNEVEFLFFGKVLRDRGYDGPYLFTQARGHRVNLPVDPEWFNMGEEGLRKIQAAKTTEPDRELVIPYLEEYKTKQYAVSQFSKAEWNSEDKNKRIQELKALKK